MRKWLLLLLISILILIISGCDQPSNEMIRDDFQRIHPKAQIVMIKPVEKSSDSYRVNISYRADTSYATETSGYFREDVFLYKKIDGKWVNTWRKSSGKK
jgi:hypothetical protein